MLVDVLSPDFNDADAVALECVATSIAQRVKVDRTKIFINHRHATPVWCSMLAGWSGGKRRRAHFGDRLPYRIASTRHTGRVLTIQLTYGVSGSVPMTSRARCTTRSTRNS